MKFPLLAALILLLGVSITEAFGPSVFVRTNSPRFSVGGRIGVISASSSDETPIAVSSPPPPSVLNGQRVVPYKILLTGLKGQGGDKVAAVYAVLKSSYQRGKDGWEHVSSIGVAHDLLTTLQSLKEQDATELNVAHVRALSFPTPQPNAMQDVAQQWRQQAVEAGATLEEKWASDVLDYLFEEDDDDEDDDDEDMEIVAEAMATAGSANGADTATIISPFDASQQQQGQQAAEGSTDDNDNDNTPLPFTADNVDNVLDEVRPYLIADGGNVSVERVDEDSRTLYLKLEGACGSCASSTVTMQMGIERILKEKFTDNVNILQVEDDEESKPKELTLEAVQEEVNRLKPAMIAMGGVVELLDIDAETGVVNMKFRGASRVQQGLELALLDVDFVNKVNFVME